MNETRAEGDSEVQAPISSSVRLQPRQKPDGSITQTPMHGVAMAAWAALEKGVIVLKV